MLQKIIDMDHSGRWAELRAAEGAILSTLTGDDLADALLRLSRAYVETSDTVSDYRKAVDYARRSADLATPGSLIYVWSSARTAAMLVDIGRFAAARRYADAFMAGVGYQPKAEVMAPWAYFAVGCSLYYSRQPLQALSWFRRGLSVATDDALRERLQVWVAWCLAAAGRPHAAFAAIPAEVHFIDHGHLMAAMARACIAAHDLEGALVNARCALQSYEAGAMLPGDMVQATELYLILKLATNALGHTGSVFVRLNTPAALAALGNRTLVSVLVPTLGVKGGDAFEADSSSRCDAAGHKRAGTRGVVG